MPGGRVKNMKSKSRPAGPTSRSGRIGNPGRDYPIAVWLGIILALTAFASFIFSFHFLKLHVLYHDNLLYFNLFRDNLQGVNQFGQFSWWFPQSQMGWPAYYYSILGDLPLGSPVFSLILIVFWILGRFGIHFNSYMAIYVAYFSFLQPLVLTLGVFAFVRQFCRNRHCLLAAIILTAFSPAVVLNHTDLGLMEPTGYFLFFCAALLHFIKTCSPRAFLIFCAACMANALLLGFNFILWNVLAIPLFIILLLFFPEFHLRHLKAALQAVPKVYLLAGAALIILCAAPSLITFSQTGELVRTKLRSGTTYSVEQLKPGNPMDFLAVSLPGFGMVWEDQNTKWTLAPTAVATHAGFNYMGIPVLALGIFGLICGKMTLRRRLIYMLIVFAGVVCLSGSSPFMATLLSVPTPLRSNDHYSDVVFRVGGFLFFIFGSVNGLHALINGGRGARGLFAALYGALFLIMLLTFVSLVGASSTGNEAFGFFALMGLIYFALFLSLWRATTRKTTNAIVSALLLVLFVDVATVGYWHLRIYWPRAESPDETAADDNVGLRTMRSNYYTENLISYQSRLDLVHMGLNLEGLPGFRGFTAAHSIKSLEEERGLLVQPGGPEEYTSLGVKTGDSVDPSMARFLKPDAPGTNVAIDVSEFKRTYNQLHFELKASDECVLFLRDAYSPYWKARINGAPTPVYRALVCFKCLVIPKGTSTVNLDFSPPTVNWLLPLAMGVFWSMMIYLGFLTAGSLFRRSGRSASP